MTLVFSSFENHLAALPAELARHGAALREQVEAVARQPAHAALSAFIFLPDQTDHPDHEDAAEVFAQAVEQMYGPRPWVGDEIPLLFFGYHALNRLSGRRTSQGFLLTDQAIYVQDDFTVMSAAPPPAQGHALPARMDDVGAFVTLLLASYKAWKDWVALAGETGAALSDRCEALLTAAVRVVLDHHAQHGSRREAAQRAWTLAGLIADHGAGDTLLDPANPKLAKKLGKLSDKFRIAAGESLQFALADFPMFGGPYGLALTAQALYSKDLMEEPIRAALERLDARSLRISEKGDQLLNNLELPITLPAHLRTALQRPFIEFLQQEVLRLQARA